MGLEVGALPGELEPQGGEYLCLAGDYFLGLDFVVGDVPDDRLDADGVHLLVLAGHEDAGDPHQVELRDGDAARAAAEVGVHQVQGQEQGLILAAVGQADLYQPVDHLGPHAAADLVVLQHLMPLLARLLGPPGGLPP